MAARAGAELAAGVLARGASVGCRSRSRGGRDEGRGAEMGNGLFKNKCELSCPGCWEQERGQAKRVCLEIAALCRAADEVPIIALSFLPFFPSSSR